MRSFCGIIFAIPRIAPKISTYSIGNSEKDKGPKLNFLVPINSAITVSTKASAWIRQSAICSFIFNPPFFAFSLCMFHSFRNRATCQHFLRRKPSLFSANICPQRRNNLKLILSDFHKNASVFFALCEKTLPLYCFTAVCKQGLSISNCGMHSI